MVGMAVFAPKVRRTAATVVFAPAKVHTVATAVSVPQARRTAGMVAFAPAKAHTEATVAFVPARVHTAATVAFAPARARTVGMAVSDLTRTLAASRGARKSLGVSVVTEAMTSRDNIGKFKVRELTKQSTLNTSKTF